MRLVSKSIVAISNPDRFDSTPAPMRPSGEIEAATRYPSELSHILCAPSPFARAIHHSRPLRLISHLASGDTALPPIGWGRPPRRETRENDSTASEATF